MPDLDPSALEHPTPDAPVTMRDPSTGKAYDIPAGQVDEYARLGFTPESVVQRGTRIAKDVRADVYGGVGGAIKAGAAGVARTATFGLSDAALAALGGGHELEQLREENPGISTAGEVGGAFLPFGAAAVAGRVGRGIAALGEGAGAIGKIGAAALGGAAEGAFFGAGQGVSELALSNDPLSVERIGSALSSNMLYGAALGAPIGGLGKAAELGLARAKGAIDGALERRALKARTPAEAIETGDLSLLDKPTLDAAEKAELERLKVAQAPQRKALVDQLDSYRNVNRDSHALREMTVGAGDTNIREAGASFVRNDISLRRMLDDRVGFAENPARARTFLRAQEQALEEINGWGQQQAKRWAQDVAAAPEQIRADIVARKVPGELGPFTPTGLDLAVERELAARKGFEWEGAIVGGLKQPPITKALPEIQGVLERNRKFQGMLDEFAKPPSSDRLAKIAEARAVLEAPRTPSFGQAVLSAAAPFAGPLGVAAAAGNRALGGFQKVLAAAGERAGKATSSFLGAATPAINVATPVATKVLASVRYAAAGKGGAEVAHTLPALFKARTDEIKSQVHIAADGTFQMRPDARQAMAAKLDGIRVAQPMLADQLETAGARRIAYLASIIPRRPDVAGAPIGPDIWQTSDIAMRSWARSAAAVEDPHAVLDRASHGAVTPEDAAAIKAVYPELLASFTNDVATQLPQLRKSLSPARKLALSYLTGVPVDPAMDPAILRVLQAQYQFEPETGGPRAEAQFGSVKNRSEVGTASQRREEGAA
jgi:hypothetical protein